MSGTGASAVPHTHWTYKLLTLLHAPVTKGSVTALTLWARQEGAPQSANNPLNTSLRTAAAVYNRGGAIPSYRTPNDGIAATYETLTKTKGVHYEAIVYAFRHDLGLLVIYQAIHASGWCTDGCGPNYPATLAAEAIKHPQLLTGDPAKGPSAIHTPAPSPTDERYDYHRKVEATGQAMTGRARTLIQHGQAIRRLLATRYLQS